MSAGQVPIGDDLALAIVTGALDVVFFEEEKRFREAPGDSTARVGAAIRLRVVHQLRERILEECQKGAAYVRSAADYREGW